MAKCDICGSEKLIKADSGYKCSVCGAEYTKEQIEGQGSPAPEAVNTSFLRVSRFGGFDKDDVLSFIDALNWYIFWLEGEKERLSSAPNSAPSPKPDRPTKTTLRTVRFGGFAKQDVIAYADKLSQRISQLESEIKALGGQG